MLVQRLRLANIGGVVTELKRCYRMAHDGKMSWSDASAAARVLRELRFCFEGEAIEGRIGEIEAAMLANGMSLPKNRPRSLNGGAEARQ
jgi:hypothetical protein